MKYIKVIIYVSLLFFVGILNVYANESYDYTFVGVNKWGNDIGNVSTALIKLEDEEGNILNTYCIDYNTSTSSNHNYSLVNVGDASYIDDTTASIITNIVKNAYPFTNLDEIKEIGGINTLTEKEAITAAQAAIWHYANKKEFELEGNTKLLYDYYLTLDGINNSTDISNIDIKENIYYEEGIRNILIEINASNVYDLKYSISKDIEEEYGVILEKNNNSILIKNVPNDMDFEINVQAKQDINNNVYFFYPEGGHSESQSLVGMSSGTINVSNHKNIKVENKYNSVTINKKDSITKKEIEGVKFKISNTSDFSEYSFESTTDKEGKITFNEIPNGTWYIKEVSTPLGYINNKETIKIEVRDENIQMDIFNDPYAKIKIIKENELGERLEGVLFDLYKDDKLIRKDIITNEIGEAIIENLDKGIYKLVEVKSKEGHVLNLDKIFVETSFGNTSEVVIVNETIGVGNLVIKKIDVDKNLLEGAKIGIYKDEECTDLYMEIETSKEEYIINDIPSGKYYIKEIKSPNGYILNLEKYEVEVLKNETSYLEIVNNKIYKTGLNHDNIFNFGIISLILFGALYIGYREC